MRIPLLTAVIFLASGLAIGQSLQIQALPPQGAVVGQNYAVPVVVTGGTQPYVWRLAQGELPPGLKLHPHKGTITGVPSVAGDYRFTVAIGDASIPKMHAQIDITIHIIAGLIVDWQEPPGIHGDRISGSALVTNQTPEEFDLTVVIVAVNEIGRATALGYQHFKLEANSASPVIPFGSSPGLGTYYVRVDAVAHHPAKHRIYRASKQTSDPLKLTQF